MKEFSENMGAVVMAIFIAMIIIFVFIFQFHLNQDKSIPLESKVSSAYCDNLKPLSASSQDECENEVLINIVDKFETLELCKQEMVNAKNLWTRSDWSDCYDKRAAELEKLNR